MACAADDQPEPTCDTTQAEVAVGREATDDQGSSVTDPAQMAGTADRVLVAARSAGLSDLVAITPGDGDAWVVKQVQRSWPEKQVAIAVDPAIGVIVDELRFAD